MWGVFCGSTLCAEGTSRFTAAVTTGFCPLWPAAPWGWCPSNLRPKAVKELTDAALRGEYLRALELQREQQPLIEALSAAVNPIPIKAAMALSGLDCGPCRLPLTAAEPELSERLQALI